MNALVNYGTDSDSDDDDNIIHTPTHTTKQLASNQAQLTASSNKDDEEEDDPILAALKDLQDFAASVNENESDPSSSGTTATSVAGAGSGETVEQDQEDLEFLSFLQEIDAIPNPDDDSQQPPPPPPPPPPLESPTIIDNIPPPPPPAPSTFTTIPSPPSTSQTDPITTTESIHQSVQMIYNRLYHISLLPSASTISQDLERRLLEFAIRVVDWKKGGLEEAYFLGEDLADALAQEAAAGVDGGGTKEGVAATLPDFGGIVGSMIQYMFRLEQMATPNGWMAVWDTEDEAYGFQHVRTGLYSPVYPSMDLITTLDPPAPTKSTHGRISPTTYKSNSWNYHSSTKTSASSPTTHTAPTTTTTMTAPTLNPWATPETNTTTSSPQSAGSDGTSSLAQSPSLINNVTKTSSSPSEPAFGTAKKKKRKLDDSTSTAASGGDDGSLFDQSIHPSRRAALVKIGGANPGSSTAKASSSSSSSSSSSKVMPKKLASLLQKWNEKDIEMSDDEDNDEDDGRDQGHQDLSNSRTGANSQSLGVGGGGDWRDRRQQHHYK
ncbi:hypothetical protein F5H01DRAFT_382142 [Linnemannia elongata]|nr:hypothetical protein F5H01DRAFT_382142 [Linnemannia elongata]